MCARVGGVVCTKEVVPVPYSIIMMVSSGGGRSKEGVQRPVSYIKNTIYGINIQASM